jgi:transposase
MALTWYDAQSSDESCNLGPLALIGPLLQRMDVAGIIDRHLPSDPQAEYGYGSILSSLLIAARLARPLALVNIPDWARASGADLLWAIPPEKLNDDRLGRALDAFYPQRHSILASLALHAAATFDLPLERLHYDPTHLVLQGRYVGSRPRAEQAADPQAPDAADPPAHITFGHGAENLRLVQAGLCVAVDRLGAVPVFGHVTDGNHNGRTAVTEQFDLLLQHLRPRRLLLISDRGTFSAKHVARVHREGLHLLCSAPWNYYRALYDAQRDHLHWQRATYLSLEQQRRRAIGSGLPQEHDNLAVLQHAITDPDTAAVIPCRVIFVFSTADQKVAPKTRQQAVTQIRTGLQALARSVRHGRRATDATAVARRVAKILGRKAAAAYFRWELQPLDAAEQAALPAPQRGCRRPTHRLAFHYDVAAGAADAAYDGLSVLVTTAPRTQSADALFGQFKEQNLVEQAHHQWKTPLAVHPVFLHTPKRVEALVYLLLIALMAYDLLQRRYRQAVPEDATVAEQRTTTETLLKSFQTYTLVLRRHSPGRVVQPTALSKRQRQILQQLGFLTPAQILSRKLPPGPPWHPSFRRAPCSVAQGAENGARTAIIPRRHRSGVRLGAPTALGSTPGPSAPDRFPAASPGLITT